MVSKGTNNKQSKVISWVIQSFHLRRMHGSTIQMSIGHKLIWRHYSIIPQYNRFSSPIYQNMIMIFDDLVGYQS